MDCVLTAPRAVLLDLDGTLVDSSADIAAAANHALVTAGREPMPAEAIARFVGDGARVLVAGVFGLPLHSPELDAHIERWRRYYASHPLDHSTWMPGAREAIASLRARQVKLAVVTNKDRLVTETILSALGVRGHFAAVWAGGDGPLKPAPDGLLETMNVLEATARETWMVGDGAQDVAAAQAAGCTSIGLLGGLGSEARLRDARPDVLIESMRQLVPIVDGASRFTR
jgi:phosphoglycolate phosphatase